MRLLVLFFIFFIFFPPLNRFLIFLVSCYSAQKRPVFQGQRAQMQRVQSLHLTILIHSQGFMPGSQPARAAVPTSIVLSASLDPAEIPFHGMEQSVG